MVEREKFAAGETVLDQAAQGRVRTQDAITGSTKKEEDLANRVLRCKFFDCFA
jgi:hypothetical protein